ncbi:hypothetical protein BJ742DRAFT_805239 [Cladochytrium replicatum]|nr:hypothetical protein BJ742DRAFT_805239 [Cladochytrium replicatum]
MVESEDAVPHGKPLIQRHAAVTEPERWQLKDQLSKKCGPHAMVYLINGDRFLGEWLDNKKHGNGTYFYSRTGSVYQGQWSDDMRNGFGTFSVRFEPPPLREADPADPLSILKRKMKLYADSKSSIFDDESREFSRKAKGSRPIKRSKPQKHDPTLTMLKASVENDKDSLKSLSASMSPSRSQTPALMESSNPETAKLRKIYAGEWKDDMRHGKGTFYYADGSYYDGRWEDDMREGWGKMYYPDGTVYEGEWHKEKRHGEGILIYTNGDRYEGTWLDDRKEGPGRFIFKSKRQMYEGEWAMGMAKCGQLIDLPPIANLPQRKYPLPRLTLAAPSLILEKEKTSILEDRVHRMISREVPEAQKRVMPPDRPAGRLPPHNIMKFSETMTIPGIRI